MRRVGRYAGSTLAAAGVLILAWTIVVWLWQDPFTAAYTSWQQHELAGQYSRLVKSFPTVEPKKLAANSPKRTVAAIAIDAARFRKSAREGQAIGRIVIPRIGLNMIIVDGTDEASLERGPGLDRVSYMPGQSRLVYIAGHRTTYLAPFSHIDAIRPGDVIKIEMPYATFTYRAVGHEIVPADDLAMLDSPKHELLRLQACHPRFFATHRYIVNAKLVTERPRAAV